MIYGVDVSNWQGSFNWTAQKIAFGFAKATEGTSFTDAQFARNWSQMRAHGLIRGAYHFGHPKNNAQAEADHFLSVVRARGLADGDLLALDLESHDDRSPATVAAWAATWCAYVQQQSGIRPLVYTFLSFARGGYCSGLGAYPLWIADPSSAAGKPRIAGPWKSWSIHQYTDKPVDKDISALTAGQLRSLGGGDDVSADDVWSHEIPEGPQFKKAWRADTHLRYQSAQGDAQLAQLAAMKATQDQLVQALANLAGLDGDALVSRIDAAVRQALADSTVDVDVHVTGGDSSGST